MDELARNPYYQAEVYAVLRLLVVPDRQTEVYAVLRLPVALASL